jgi:rubrerythrin
MSYTDPKGQPQGHAYSFVNKIRESLIAELSAINQYQEHIASSNMREINDVWQGIIKDEKNHYGLFLSLIEKYDPDEYREYLKYKDIAINVTAMQAYEPHYENQIILNNIREDIKGELEAVILYEDHISAMSYQDIKDVFAFVINDEKEHIEHLTRVLLKFDPDKYNNFK